MHENIKTSDKTGHQLLVHFFTKGNVSNVSTALQYQREKKIRAPCLFAVPRSLWKDTDGPDGRELVMDGTYAMVFRVSFNKLGELLKEVSKSRKKNGLHWVNFLKIEGEKWKEQAEGRMSRYAQKILQLIFKHTSSRSSTMF
jgi:hypothetical protein